MNKIILKKYGIKEFQHIYTDMLNQFPKNELKTYETFEKLISENKLNCFGIYDNDKEVGYLIYANLSNSIWLDYIAIKKEYHSNGYGKKVISKLDNCYLEVEKPDINQPNTLRRINFYESLGARKLNIDYIYPNNDGGYKMDLYYLGKNLPDKETLFSDIKEVFATLHSDIQNTEEILKMMKIHN